MSRLVTAESMDLMIIEQLSRRVVELEFALREHAASDCDWCNGTGVWQEPQDRDHLEKKLAICPVCYG